MSAMLTDFGYFNNLQERFVKRDVAIGIFGMSKEGLRLAVRQAESGFKVNCFDLRDYKLDMVRKGISFANDISDNELWSLVKRGFVKACDDFSRIRGLDFLAICIPEEESAKPGYYNIKEISMTIARNMDNGLIIGLDDIEKSDNLKIEVDKVLKSSGFRYTEDYLFGAITVRG